jgi:hypothetical protein
MLDISHLAGNPKFDVQVFYANSPVAGAGWVTWTKPRGINFVQFFVLSGGCGGGSGVFGTASLSAGGGGGASGSQAIVTFPAWAIPDTLYISVGNGGLGGAPVTSAGAGQVGLAGIASHVAIYPDTTLTAQNLLIKVNAGVAGAAATGATAGTAGTAAAITLVSASPLAALGTFYSSAVLSLNLAGIVGNAGGTTGAAAAFTLGTSGLVVTPGTGGGGVGLAATTGAAGGNITGAGTFPTLTGGIIGGTTTAAGGFGSNGIQPIRGLWFFYGGTGGASGGGAGGRGGMGGDGAYGCGGGGGGGAITVSSGGGGKGGDGIVVATSW